MTAPPEPNPPPENNPPEMAGPMELNGTNIAAGTRVELELRPARLPSGSWMGMPVVVLRGERAGPTMWLSAAIHGDEVCGVEIIRQVLRELSPDRIAGTLLAVPVVNVPGFASGQRYLPARRDLNRCFPGSPRGSLGSRFANLFMTEIVSRCTFGIDLHTGSDHRSNLPQIRADLDDEMTATLASAFGAPVALHARLRDGSLREAAVGIGATTLLYEAGEAWRFDPAAIDVGVRGVLNVMAHVEMIGARPDEDMAEPRFIRRSVWMRSPMSGVARVRVDLGEQVEPGSPLAIVADVTGTEERWIRSKVSGIVIGRSEAPVVHRGDALVHLGELPQGRR